MTPTIKRNFFHLGTLFTGAKQYENFSRAKDLFPTTTLTASSTPYDWPEGEPIELPETFEHYGQTKSMEEHFQATDSGALLVLHDGKVRYERYALTGGRNVQWASWSVAKSFTSTLIGIALEEGLIKSIDEPVSNYVQVQPGSAYDGVPIRTVLRMRSGARWVEEEWEPDNDFAKLADAADSEQFIASLGRAAEPDTVFLYNTADTQALGSVLKHATGRTVTDYMQEKLFEPLGMTDEGYWLIDGTGAEAAGYGLNMTARDYARLGELYRNDGMWQGKSIVTKEWVTDATSSPEVYYPGSVVSGYGYQWWTLGGDRGDYTAAGIYNQRVYVDPARKVTIVKLSANPRFGLSGDDADNRSLEVASYLRAIADVF